jgi:hypothetical protein
LLSFLSRKLTLRWVLLGLSKNEAISVLSQTFASSFASGTDAVFIKILLLHLPLGK